ncbi:MAG: hypothetical protein R2751_10495 [Bacteroidales bacterium]
MKEFNWILVLLLVLVAGCSGNKSSQELDINDMLTEESTEPSLEISEETLNEILQSVPSPIELAAVIRSSGSDFQEDILNPEKNRDQYNSTYDKALNIGVYGADLGYINMYEKSYLALNYLGAIKKLADDLQVGHFFDFATIRRLASNSDKMDSLLYISTSNMNKMDSYLRTQKRGNLSALILAGSWVEGIYLATQVASHASNAELMERIGEQKVVLDQLLFIISVYETDPYFKELSGDFDKIKSAFDEVEIVYNYQEPETMEVDGRLVIVNKSTTEVRISPENLDVIREIVREVRGGMVAST